MTRNATVKGNLCIKGLSFEQVGDFKYLRVNVNEKTICTMKLGWDWMPQTYARCYITMKEMLSSKLLYWHTKERLYYTYLRPIVSYACETWFSTQGDEERLLSFERKYWEKYMDQYIIMTWKVFKKEPIKTAI